MVEIVYLFLEIKCSYSPGYEIHLFSKEFFFLKCRGESFRLALVPVATNAVAVKPKLMSFHYTWSSQPSALINMIIKQSAKWRGLQWSLLLIKVVIKLSSAIACLQRPTGFVFHLPLRWHININRNCKSLDLSIEVTLLDRSDQEKKNRKYFDEKC